jgi:hypothetical protein
MLIILLRDSLFLLMLYVLKYDIMLFLILSQSVPTNLRRSTRKRRLSAHLEDYTDSSGSEDEDLMVRIYTLASPQFLCIHVTIVFLNF